MSKKFIFVAILIAIAGLAASFFLMPRSQEIALMQMKDKNFEDARIAYEGQLASGNLSIEVVTRLSELYLQTGEVNKAIEVMEKFIAANPANLEARRQVGTYYQYAQRQDDYLRNLEEINKLEPRPENLKVLSDIYNFNTEYNKQADTLKKLIEKDQGADAKHFSDLAYILASEKKFPEAVTTLQGLKQQHPERFSFNEMELLVTLLFDDKKPDEAQQESDGWIKANLDKIDQNARLINIAHYRGSPAMAKQLMANYNEQQINEQPALLEQHILLMLADGKDAEAYQQLKALYANDKLTPELRKRLLFAALLNREEELAKNIAKDAPFKSYSEAELVSLAELSSTQEAGWLLKQLTQTFPDAEYKDTYPVLVAMLAVSNNRSDADVKLAELDRLSLSSAQILQVARVCARHQRNSCTERFVGKLPPAEQLSDLEVANVGNLYLDLRQWDKGYRYMQAASKNRSHPEISQVMVKYEAVRGNSDAVEKWLMANKDTVSQRMLADLYFASLNAKQLPTAVMVAEFYHGKQNTSQSRSYLAQAYVQTGQFEDALKLLRDNKPMTEDDENNYLMALAKLSGRDPAYRKELTDFASAKLRSDISKKQKMALVYALITAKAVEPAMPAIRELALSEGGQWAALYAETLDKQGRHSEAREFWLTVANQPSTSAKQKREIAYNLLNGGFKDDAAALFLSLAGKESADSKAVKELLYLWGPRPDDRAMSWLESRYLGAAGAERNAWGRIISSYASSDWMLAFIERNPSAINDAGIIRGYLQALVSKGLVKEKEPELLAMAKESSDAIWLKEYARATRDLGLLREARHAYETLVTVDPTDDVALREAGTSSFFQADYSSSQLYLDQYVHSNVNYGLDDKAHQGFFYYAELLRREKKLAEANRYYESAIQRIDANKLNSTEALAIRAQSQVWMGDVEGGLKAFDEARARHPQDDLLRADQISTLLELKRYDEARALLALPRHSHLNSVSSETVIPTAGGTVRDYQLISPNELLIRYHKPEQTNQAAQALKDTPWVNYTSEGYDTLLVASRPGTMIEINKSGSEPSFKAVVDNASPSYQDERQIALRYELLAARADLETGNVYHATSRLNDLAPEYPNDAQLKGFLANAENYGGNWPRALTLLKEARTITPENEDLARLDRDIRRLNSPNVKIDHEWVKRGRNQEQITTLSGYVDAADNIQVGANLQNDHVRAKNIRRADGRIGNFSENRQRGELYAQVHGDNGMRAKLSLYGNNDTAGVGGTFSFLNMLGETTLAADLHRPYWDYVEGVLDDATRDRLSLVHTIKPTQRLVLSAGGNVNVYNVDVKDNVISTAGFEFDAVYRLLDEQPYLAVAYSVDGEYETSSKRGTDSQGGFTRLFPLRSRELHFISVNAGYEFDDVTYGNILLGYGYDRLTGNSGPSIEGRLTHELTEHLDAQIRASYGIDNGSSNNDVNISRVGGYVRWRF